jgi:hypothetical protein
MCLNPTIFLDNREHTLVDLNSLGIIMLEMLDETRESLKSIAVDWSAKVVNFVEATSSTILDKLLDVSFPNI